MWNRKNGLRAASQAGGDTEPGQTDEEKADGGRLGYGARIESDIVEIALHARVIAATNRPVAEAVSHNHLRADLLYRLAVFHIEMPALRQDGPTWQDGSALYYVLHQNLWVTDFGAWVVEHTPLEWIRRLSHGFRGTELALTLTEPKYAGVPLLNTVGLHVDAALEWLLAGA